MMHRLLLLLCLICSVLSFIHPEKVYQKAFKEWVGKHNKQYQNSEVNRRYQIFKNNYDYIYTHNHANPPHTYRLGVNKFADLTKEEFQSKYLKFKPSSTVNNNRNGYRRFGDLPSRVDWVDKNAVTDVKDQGQCGSCWSFSTTGAIEGAWAIKNGTLVSLSEQNIIDCSWNNPYNNTGCDGGDMRAAMQYVIDNKGLDTEDSYPYEDYNGGDQEPCTYNPKDSAARISAMSFVISKNETDLAYATVKGPVSVAIDASQDSFQFYEWGIYYDAMCESDMDDLDHGVLVVGYDNDDGYWIVKNSWGEDWGNAGYIWMLKGYNTCGIATYATLPIV